MFNKLKYLFISKDLKNYIDNAQDVMEERCFFNAKVKVDDKLNVLKTINKSFSETLLNFIDEKNLTDVECYKKANIDRKLFSKIRSNVDYKPSKNTVLAFVVALKLSLKEANILLNSAGYSLSHSFITDIVVEYFILNKKYNIDLINIALYEYNQQPLGSF